MNKIEQCADLICKSNNIMVLTGAGMSTESGIPDFRSSTGLYTGEFHGLSPEEILSVTFFKRNPEVFWSFIATHMDYSGAIPNPGHFILAKWEQNKNITIVTQNIEELHTLAGSSKVIEIHGTIKTATCQNIDCMRRYSLKDVITKKNGYLCSCGSLIKPDIVLYEESVSKIISVYPLVRKADLLIVLGTSLAVYPVAGIPELFHRTGNHMIIINHTPTKFYNYSNCTEIHDSIGKTLEAIDNLLSCGTALT
jgi:NAD-dependent deacetylase